MPYIPKSRRDAIFNESKTDFNSTIKTKGELNFRISELLGEYVELHGVSYQNLSDAINAAIDAAEEFRRQCLNPYEDFCIKKNGDLDVYKRIKKLIKEKL